MDFSKLKLGIYDFLGVILPGLLATAEGWISLRGWNDFINSITHLTGPAITLLLVFAFGLGHVVGELGDVFVHFLKGDRYLRKGRDQFWATDEALLVKRAIECEFGHEINSVDVAYDYCLTKLKGHFGKRDIFIATSDLCRSLVALSMMAIVPTCRIAFVDVSPLGRSLLVAALTITGLSLVAALSWRRMNRYRELSEATVFRVYMGLAREDTASTSGALK